LQLPGTGNRNRFHEFSVSENPDIHQVRRIRSINVFLGIRPRKNDGVLILRHIQIRDGGGGSYFRWTRIANFPASADEQDYKKRSGDRVLHRM